MNAALRNPFALVGAAAVAAALALPASASATVTVNAAGDPITFTGDDAADNLVLTVSGGKIAHNLPATQGFASPTDLDPNTPDTQERDVAGANIVIRGGGGADILNAAGLGNTYNSLEIHGDAGDDTITGGGKSDRLVGGDGDDRVVGGPGTDLMNGGIGNDVLVWNNGDGSDTMDGEAGNDEIEVNGSANAGDDFRITPGVNGRTSFDRVNLVAFNLDTSAERMTVSGLGGDDTIAGAAGLAGRVLLTLNGNTGLDTIAGGDGADRVSGGEAADVLDGGAGDDKVTGDRGGDQMRGGAGDDVLEWNDGDGSDVATGGDGADLTRVNGSVTQGDAFEVAPNGQGIRFQRTNLVPFTIDLDTERIEMNTLGGNDTIAVKKGLAGRLRVLADGGSSDDRILARNGAVDRVQGGSGTDSAVVDRKDQVEDVEQVKRYSAWHAKVASKVKVALRDGRYVATLWVSCPARADSSCHGVLRIRTAKGHAVLASKRLNLDPGERAKVKVKLSGKAKSAAKGGKLALRAVIV
jgi:RTX calcium-binding nonapeptide repeat (4 copies)